MDLGLDKIPYHQVQGVQFGIYSIQEIEKLSALEITNVTTFDALGHPAPGGLYDLKLGASERDDVCDTCSLNSIYCPGHLGHINLPLPVFNPFLFRTLHKILQGACFQCHCFIVPPCALQLVLHQLKALDYGLVSEIDTLGEMVSQFESQMKDNSVSQAVAEIKLTGILSEYLHQQIEKLDQTKHNGICVKNVMECKTRIVKNFMRNCFGKARKCMNCGCAKTSLSIQNNSRLIMATRSNKVTPVRKAATSRFKNSYENFDDLDNDEQEVASNTMEESLSLTSDNSLKKQSYLTALEARKTLRLMWENDRSLLQQIYSILKTNNQHQCPVDIFFFDAIIVPPCKFRPLCQMRGKKFEHPQSQLLNKVLSTSITLNHVVKCQKLVEQDETILENVRKIPGKSEGEKLTYTWNELQMAVNAVLDSDLDKLTAETKKHPGIKQLLEKKEGLFRKHMMGKRVNYAARSVISPDPYIMVDEIGVPMIFASKLTYPQPVTPWNVRQLREAVINGPDVHPGAVLVENEDGSIIKLNAKHKVQREGIAKQLLTPSQSSHNGIRGCKIVYRHLLNGDVLLLNRQPTLHKPSIMAHKARVLPGEKTLRLHYANCKTYNADFDGDEMNAHFPQSELGRAEAYNIASVRNQYLVPKDGTPLSGLIQDHMIAGVMISLRGKFFNREDYQGLVYGALTFVRRRIVTLPPAIRKPVVLWSGKQIISTIMLNVIPEGMPPPSLEGKSKIASKTWQTHKEREWLGGGTPLTGDSMSEAEVVIHQGELLCGVLDKAHYGPTAYGLVHCCYEIYGGETSCLLLTSLARLFTHFLQIHSGFTLGIEDILVTPKANKKRWRIMKKARQVGNEAAAEALGVPDPSELEELRDKLEGAHRCKDDIGLKQLDNSMKSKTDSVNNEINKACFPNGLFKLFPSNNLQLMVQSGAKGSMVNCMQISCLLGQIELEGRRVPLMMSGKTLPSFLPYDTSPRAGGFIDGRFLTGIRPQEFFFHCMAGREGLVDTAVKTSRSGYLQRCLIKHLEGLTVNYDLTVRDSDGSVIQFYYGEDGLDISKRQMLNPKMIHLMVRNHDAVMQGNPIEKMRGKIDFDEVAVAKKKGMKWKKRHGSLCIRNRVSGFGLFALDNPQYFRKHQTTGKIGDYEECKNNLQEAWWNLNNEKKEKYLKKVESPPDPVFSQLRSDTYFGAISEKWEDAVQDYAIRNPDNLLQTDKDDDFKRNHLSTQRKRLPVEDFQNMMYYRTMRSLCDPGEAVGLLAAQSIGEPSTQMTLNTFHFAGRGEMNVTLGIPRLREILMTASPNIATPSMDLPLLMNVEDVEQRAEKLRIKLNTVRLSEVLERIDVTEEIRTKTENRTRLYCIKFSFLPHKCYKDKFCVKPKRVLHYMESVFFLKLLNVINKKFSDKSQSSLISFRRERKSKSKGNEDEESEMAGTFEENNAGDGGESSDDGEGDGDTTSAKNKSRHDQETEYDDPEMEEAEINADEGDYIEDDEINESMDLKEEANEEKDAVQNKSRKRKHTVLSNDEKAIRINNVCDLDNIIEKYEFDGKKELWCQIDIALDMQGSKFDMTSLLENEARTSVVYQVKGINRAFLVKDIKGKAGCEKMLKTDGVNFLEMFHYEDILDVRKIYSNDIHAIARTYGIEAAAKAISREVTNVFAAYGIEVDPRHLLLLADYMTFDGTFRACNRATMEFNASPLQQMTFETTMTFLRTATLSNIQEELKSPSARLVLGRVVKGGTGCFELRESGKKKRLAAWK